MSDQLPGPASHSFISQRLRLHYVDWGNPDAPPLVLVHGGQDHCRNWDWVAQDLRRDYHVIAPDLRGHGDSEHSSNGDYSMSGYVYDLAQLIHQQKLAPVKIIAHSLGGNIALRYAGIYPETVSKLVAIEGLGPSPEMLEKARKSGIKADWELADLATWTASAPYDVIFSNATYQWLPHHDVLLPRLLAFVKPGGVFAFQVPNNMQAPSHVLMRETGAAGPWAAKLKNVREVAVQPTESYYDLLRPLAASVDIWETEYLQVLKGEDAVYHWVSGTGLRPFVAALDDGEREGFIAEYKTRLNKAYPPRADGTTLFPFKRLFAVVKV